MSLLLLTRPCDNQVYCLNTALKLYTSVVVVPVFYGTYTALGLVNTIIYLDEIGNYPGWAIALVFIGIGVLIYGVYLLSSKPDPSHPHRDADDEEEEHHQDLTPLNNDTAIEERLFRRSDNKSWPTAKDEKYQLKQMDPCYLVDYVSSSSPALPEASSSRSLADQPSLEIAEDKKRLLSVRKYWTRFQRPSSAESTATSSCPIAMDLIQRTNTTDTPISPSQTSDSHIHYSSPDSTTIKVSP